jgi:hypothetical protein
MCQSLFCHSLAKGSFLHVSKSLISQSEVLSCAKVLMSYVADSSGWYVDEQGTLMHDMLEKYQVSRGYFTLYCTDTVLCNKGTVKKKY